MIEHFDTATFTTLKSCVLPLWGYSQRKTCDDDARACASVLVPYAVLHEHLMRNISTEILPDCANNYMQHQLLNPSITKDVPVMNAIICVSKRIGQKYW